MVRWGALQNKALRKLFESGIADPQVTKPDAIDPIHDIDPVFTTISIERFRENYKNAASKYLTGKALNGIRRSECGLLLFFIN